MQSSKNYYGKDLKLELIAWFLLWLFFIGQIVVLLANLPANAILMKRKSLIRNNPSIDSCGAPTIMSFHKIKLLLKPPSFQNVGLTSLEFM